MSSWNADPDVTITTTQLLNALRDPKELAWNAFDGRYRPIIHGLARRMGLSADTAAEVAQETMARFAEAYRAGRYERQRGRLRSFLIGIARHRITDELRAKYRSPIERGESALGAMPADVDFDTAWQQELEAAVLLASFDRLRSESRAEDRTLRAFELMALRGLPAPAVAEACDLKPEEVYRIKHRMTARLRVVIDEMRTAYEEDG